MFLCGLVKDKQLTSRKNDTCLTVLEILYLLNPSMVSITQIYFFRKVAEIIVIVVICLKIQNTASCLVQF